jgi:NADH-quinone oxidoreductase subunit H
VLWAAICAGAFLGKVLLLCWVQLVIRWTLPRFRFDQIQKLCWKMLLPLTLANIFVTGAVILIDPSLELLAIIGLVELVAMVLLTSAVSRRAEAAVTGHGHGAPAHAPADHGHAVATH